MAMVTGTYRNGTVVLDEPAPAEWADGTRVRVETGGETIGMREEDWDDSPEGIAAWIKQYDALEPFLTEEEEVEFNKVLARQKAAELASDEERLRKLRESAP